MASSKLNRDLTIKDFLQILLITIIVALVFSPFFVTENMNNNIVVMANLISALASVFTFVIALLLYSKYGVEKSLIDKQTEAVLSLLVELKKRRFVMSGAHGINITMLQVFLDSLDDEYINTYRYKKLFFHKDYFENLEILEETVRNIFLPPIIASKLSLLTVHSISYGDIDMDSNDFFLVNIPVNYDMSNLKDFGQLNMEDITLGVFIDRWKDVIEETKKWLKEYSNTKVELNF